MPKSSKPVVFSAPAGWGKSSQAEQLRREYQCTSIAHEWNPSRPLTPGAIHLTNCPPASLKGQSLAADIVARGWQGDAP